MRILSICLLALILLGCSYDIQGQTSHELGVRFSNFRDFSAIYKKELKENRFLRIRNVSSALDYSGVSERTGLNIGGALGYELRTPINTKDHFVHGPELGVSFRFAEDTPTNNYFRLSYLFGLNHQVGENLKLGIEFTPSIIMSGIKENFDYDLLLNLSTVGITALYSFQTKEKENSM